MVVFLFLSMRSCQRNCLLDVFQMAPQRMTCLSILASLVKWLTSIFQNPCVESHLWHFHQGKLLKRSTHNLTALAQICWMWVLQSQRQQKMCPCHHIKTCTPCTPPGDGVGGWDLICMGWIPGVMEAVRVCRSMFQQHTTPWCRAC